MGRRLVGHPIEAALSRAAPHEHRPAPLPLPQPRPDEPVEMLRLSDALEDLDDIQGVYANYDISEEEMAKLA